MTRQKAFSTAAARRRANPIEWVIDDETIRLRASVELVELADLLEILQTPFPEGVPEIRAAQDRRDVLIDNIRNFLEPGAHEAFSRVEKDLDFIIVTEMVQELVMEYTGQSNPTQQSSSSDGSSETGSSLTAGADLEP
jgi:hypothetical protein